ncbi:MAG: GNAT family N-acetyltransferase [Oscillospiraceae bacterium]|nr:GNAT family N-acetyltransferase [Oscillospiraceae bacterium]
MEIHFAAVTPENRERILALQILPEQREYIETVDQCLAEAGCVHNWRPVGIYNGELLVGFAMYGYFFWEYLPCGRLWLDRFLIDRHYQGQGYGKEALDRLLKRLTEEYSAKDIYLSVIQGNEAAIRLYQSFGFRFTGEKDTHGEDVMRRPGNRPVGFMWKI